ncbi:MAG: hypothetical protein WCF68_07145 [Terriglobales bacterium]
MRILSVVLFLVASLFAESVAGLMWTKPAAWKTEAERPMRAATYTIAPAPGDTANAECVVYFFGAGQGGGVQANLDRWKGQLLGPGGKPAEAKIAKRTIHGLPVTTIDATGDYTGMGGPMAASKSVQSNYRLLGAIFEGPGGNVFVKFTGPAKTIAANQTGFDQFLNSFDKDNSKRGSGVTAQSNPRPGSPRPPTRSKFTPSLLSDAKVTPAVIEYIAM